MIRPQSKIVIWLTTTLLTAVTIGISYALQQWLGVTTPILFVIPVAVAAWMGGLWPGLFATLLSGVAFSFILSEPAFTFDIGLNDVVRLAALVFVALVVNWLEVSRRRLEAKAQQARDELSHILQESGNGITVQGPDGRLIYANPEGARLVGYATPEALMKATIQEIMASFEVLDEHGQTLPITDLPSRRALLGETPEPAMLRFRVKGSGEERWSLVRATPVRNADGSLRFVVNNFQDITSIKRAEAGLQTERERLLVTLASIGDAVIATDAQGRITFMNRVAERLTGWPATEAAGQPLPVVFDIIDEKTRETIPNPVEIALRENRTVELANSTVLRSRAGIDIPIEDSAAPICDEQDKVSGVVLVFRDVTGKKRREAAQRFILQVSTAFDTSLDFDLTMQSIAEMTVPGIADWAAIDLIGEDGRLYEAALVHQNLAEQRRVHDIRMKALEAEPQIGLIVDAAKSGKAQVITDYGAETLRGAGWTEDQLPMLLDIPVKHLMVVPLKVADETIGVLTLGLANSGRTWTQDDLALGEQLADRAAVAIQNARLFRDVESQRERLRVTLSSIGDAVISTDTNGRIVFLNQVAQNLTGWSQDDAIGKPLNDVFVIVNEDTRATVESPVTKVLREGKIVGLANHTILIARDGTEIPIDDSGAPIRDGEGDLIGVILVFRDISERKVTEAQIEALGEEAESERKRLDEIVRNIPGVVWEAWGAPDAATQRNDYVSEYVEQMLGYSREEWLNTPNFWHTIVHPDDQEHAAASSRAIFESGQAGTNQFRWLTKDGRAIWVEAHANVMLDASGSPVGMRGVTFDISERKESEEMLVQQNEVIETINRVGQTLSGELDLEALLQSLTDAATELTGAQVGAFFYNVKNTEGESYMLYTLSGVPPERFTQFPMPRNTEIFAPTFKGEGVVRSDDITQDPRYGQNAPYEGMPEGHLPVRSYLAIPVVSRSGEVIGGLFFGHEKVGVFSEREERIVEGLAAQAAIAVDNARLFREVNDQREQLRESAQQLRVITDSLPVLISYIDADLRYQFNNRVYEEWFGHSREEVQGKTMPEVLGEEAAAALRPNIDRALSGETARFETLVPYDAGTRFINGTYVPDIDREGKVKGFFVLVADISERRAMETALRESEVRFRTIFEQAAVGIVQSTLEGDWVDFNRRTHEMLGYSFDELMATGSFRAITHPDDIAEDDDLMRRVFSGEIENYQREKRNICKDGSVIWVLVTATLVRDASNKPLYWIGIIEDISERRKAETEQQFLADVSEALSTSLDYEQTLQQVAHLAVPRMADWCAIDLITEDSEIERVAVHHINPDKIEVFWKLWELAKPHIDEPMGTGKVIRTGEPDLLFDIPPALIDQAYEEPIRGMLHSLGLRASIVLPLMIDGKAIGSLTMVMAESGRRFGEGDVDLAQELARRAAAAIDRARLYRETGEQRERLRVTLGSIGDAVIATDAQGRVTFINPVAERLTGWSFDQAVGERIEVVFQIVNEETGDIAENPVNTVLATGKIVGLANHTMLISRDGDRVPIDDSGAPIRMANGEIVGVILVFRDIRERKAVEFQRDTYARQQAVIARLGQQALMGLDIQQLMNEAVRAMASTLKLDYVKVLEMLPDEQELLLRAGVGWKDGLVGVRRVGAGTGSHAGFTLLAKGPVIMDDLRSEARFVEPMLTEHNVVSGMSVLIEGREGQPWGVLGAHTRTKRTFSQDDIHFLQAVANVLAEAIQRKYAREELERSLERTRDLYEISRRIGAANSHQEVLDALISSTLISDVHTAYIMVYDKPWGHNPPNHLEVMGGWRSDPSRPDLRGARFPFAELALADFISPTETMIVKDAFNDPRVNQATRNILSSIDTRSIFLLPLTSGGQNFGLLGLYWQEAHEVLPIDLPHLHGLIDQASATMYNLLLVEVEAEARRTAEKAEDRTRELYEISRRIGSLNSAQQILEALLSSSALKEVKRAIITMFTSVWDDEMPEAAELIAEWQQGNQAQTWLGQRYTLATYDLARVVRRNEPVIIGDVETDSRLTETSRQFSLAMGIRSYIVFPLIASNQWFGLLSLQWEQPFVAGEGEARHLQGLVDQAASAIYNLRLLEDEARARRAAEKADALKMKFLAMISHELRTPLTSIKGFTTTLLSEDVEWDALNQREFLSIINEESDNLTDLIEQLLDLSRLEAGTLTIQKRVQSLNEIFAQAMPQLFMIANQHRLEVDVPLDLPLVDADGRRITQVISNIVANAAKYSPENTLIRITAEVSADQVQINVIDQGHGIPEAEHDIVFEAFRQAENRPKEETKGAGLGLAISRGLLEAHGGQIWISESGAAGTTVSFTLPTAG